MKKEKEVKNPTIPVYDLLELFAKQSVPLDVSMYDLKYEWDDDVCRDITYDLAQLLNKELEEREIENE